MAKQRPSIAELRSAIWYNPFSGEMKWKMDMGYRVKKGGTAGFVNKRTGYAIVGIWGQQYGAHRVAWAIYYGKWPEGCVDHIDGDRSNNRKDNLRLATRSENNQNRGVGVRSKSGVVGISWDSTRGGWSSSITANGVRRYLGVYATKEAASKRYAEEKRRMHKFQPDQVSRQAAYLR